MCTDSFESEPAASEETQHPSPIAPVRSSGMGTIAAVSRDYRALPQRVKARAPGTARRALRRSAFAVHNGAGLGARQPARQVARTGATLAAEREERQAGASEDLLGPADDRRGPCRP
jgi:hypothetical protein